MTTNTTQTLPYPLPTTTSITKADSKQPQSSALSVIHGELSEKQKAGHEVERANLKLSRTESKKRLSADLAEHSQSGLSSPRQEAALHQSVHEGEAQQASGPGDLGDIFAKLANEAASAIGYGERKDEVPDPDAATKKLRRKSAFVERSKSARNSQGNSSSRVTPRSPKAPLEGKSARASGNSSSEANSKLFEKPLMGTEAKNAITKKIPLVLKKLSSSLEKTRAENAEANPHEQKLAENLNQASTAAKRRKVFTDLAKPGAVIALGRTHNGDTTSDWASFLPIFSEELSASPEKFLVVMDGVPSAATRDRMKNYHNDLIPQALLAIEGLEIQGSDSGPWQDIASNSTELLRAISGKYSKKEVLPKLQRLLDTAIELNLLDKKTKKSVEQAFKSGALGLGKVKETLRMLEKAATIDKVLKEQSSPAASQGKLKQIERLMEKHPDRTIIVLDSFANMHTGTRVIEEPDYMHLPFELDSEEDLQKNVDGLLKIRTVPGWVDSLPPALRKQTFSFPIENTAATSKSTEGKLEDIASYRFADQKLGKDVQKMHRPNIMLSIRALKELRD